MYKASSKYITTSQKLTRFSRTKIVVGDVEYAGSLYIKDPPKFKHTCEKMIGEFPVKSCEFSMWIKNGRIDLIGKEIKIYKGLILDNNSIEWIPQGVFFSEKEDVTTSDTGDYITVKCYDKAKAMSTIIYEDNNTYPIDDLTFVKNALAKYGYELENETFPKNITINEKPNFEINISLREVVRRFGEIHGCNCFFSRTGKVEIKQPYNTELTYKFYSYKKLTLEDKYGNVDRAILGNENYNNDIVFPSKEDYPNSKYGLKIKNNPFVDLKKQNYVEQVYDNIKNLSVIPFKAESIIDNFILDINDIITVQKKDGTYINLTILSIETKDRIKCNLACKTQKEDDTNYNLAGNVKNDINRLKLDVSYIENTITALSSKITDMLNYIKEVSFIGNNIKLENTPTSHGAINKLSITNFTLQTLYPNMTYPSKYTKPNVLNFYTLIFSNEEVIYSPSLPSASVDLENKIFNIEGIGGKYYRCVLNKDNEIYEWVEATDFEHQEVYINSPVPLSGSDEMLIENNNIKIIHGTEKYDLGAYTIPTYETDTYVTFKYFKNLTFNAKYLVKNDFTTIFATQVETIAEMQILANEIALRVTQAEVDNSIKVAVDSINLEVSKKVNSDEIISSINLSPEEIKILAKKIQFEGLVTANEYFKILLDGSIEAKNGSFSGNIYLGDGGLVIGGNGILSTMIVQGTVNSPSFLLMGDFCPMGDYSNNGITECLAFTFYIPDNFHVTSAYIYLQHEPCETSHYDNSNNIINTTGYCRNLALYKGNISSNSKKHISETNMPLIGNLNASYSQITKAWKNSGTLFNGKNNEIVTDMSIDLKDGNHIDTGLNHFAIMSSTNHTDYGTTAYCERRGAVLGTMYIQGYLSN